MSWENAKCLVTVVCDRLGGWALGVAFNVQVSPPYVRNSHRSSRVLFCADCMVLRRLIQGRSMTITHDHCTLQLSGLDATELSDRRRMNYAIMPVHHVQPSCTLYCTAMSHVQPCAVQHTCVPRCSTISLRFQLKHQIPTNGCYEFSPVCPLPLAIEATH
jgi:hypothetical protein